MILLFKTTKGKREKCQLNLAKKWKEKNKIKNQEK